MIIKDIHFKVDERFKQILVQDSKQTANKHMERCLTIFVVLVAKLCPTLCDPMDCNPPGSSVHGISQITILEWDVTSFSRGSSMPPAFQVDSLPLSHQGSPSLGNCKLKPSFIVEGNAKHYRHFGKQLLVKKPHET